MAETATIQLDLEQKKTFFEHLKTGAIKELGRKGLLTDQQIQKILSK